MQNNNNQSYEYALTIINKLSDIMRFSDKKILYLLETHDGFDCHFDANGCLESITIQYYDSLHITNNNVVFQPEFGSKINIIGYDNFDNLLNGNVQQA